MRNREQSYAMPKSLCQEIHFEGVDEILRCRLISYDEPLLVQLGRDGVSVDFSVNIRAAGNQSKSPA
jgi:hypothetical protein